MFHTKLQLLYNIENRQINFDTFKTSGNRMSGAILLHFDHFDSLTLAENIDIYLSFVIIYDNLLKYTCIAVTILLLQ